ncbi:hypothetical protein Val02_34200 [Virgisporangium aliadipatigenens]|uniref:Uncharacterized protein n=1 Tax=Virgisporangium aliadipatigenens TaxID=741659 RepID=A0A8J3YJM9_9ACTN|nr:hypothetical protein Val02_34200 [Virgisporangium aliadipatigenens]
MTIAKGRGLRAGADVPAQFGQLGVGQVGPQLQRQHALPEIPHAVAPYRPTPVRAAVAAHSSRAAPPSRPALEALRSTG